MALFVQVNKQQQESGKEESVKIVWRRLKYMKILKHITDWRGWLTEVFSVNDMTLSPVNSDIPTISCGNRYNRPKVDWLL